MDALVLGADGFDDVPCAVRRSVVDDEDLESRILLQHGENQARDVLALVVRGNDDQRAFGHEASGCRDRAPAIDYEPSDRRDECERYGNERDSLSRLIST